MIKLLHQIHQRLLPITNKYAVSKDFAICKPKKYPSIPILLFQVSHFTCTRHRSFSLILSDFVDILDASNLNQWFSQFLLDDEYEQIIEQVRSYNTTLLEHSFNWLRYFVIITLLMFCENRTLFAGMSTKLVCELKLGPGK